MLQEDKTHITRVQTNRVIYGSSVMHKVEGKYLNLLKDSTTAHQKGHFSCIGIILK